MTTSLECTPAYSTPSHTHKASRKIISKKTTNSLFESPFSNINGPIYFGERRQMPKLMIRLGQDFCTSSAICINLKVWVKLYSKSNQSLKGYINKSQQSKKRIGMQTEEPRDGCNQSMAAMGTNSGRWGINGMSYCHSLQVHRLCDYRKHL